MATPPVPGGPNDRLEVAPLGTPVERSRYLGVVRKRSRRVARSTWLLDNGEVDPGDETNRVDDLAIGMAPARSDVEHVARHAIVEGFERPNVGVGEVGRLDVIANAGPVRRIVVGAE